MEAILCLLFIWCLILSKRLKKMEKKMIEDNEDALKRFNEEMHNNKTGDLPNSQNAQNVRNNFV